MTPVVGLLSCSGDLALGLFGGYVLTLLTSRRSPYWKEAPATRALSRVLHAGQEAMRALAAGGVDEFDH